jgi:IS30 family transposase
MDNYNSTLNNRKNKHLNSFERGQIQLLLSEGLGIYGISQKLGRAYNTIKNEVNRGTVKQIKKDKEVLVYYPDVAERKYKEARKNCGPKFKLLECEEFIEHVNEEFFEKEKSIDAICGRAAKFNIFEPNQMVTTKTLYNYIELGLLEIKNIDLPLKLRRSEKKTKIRKRKKVLGKSIEERPDKINERSEFGHWEIDTMIGKKTSTDEVLLTLTERLSRKELILKMNDKTVASVREGLNKIIDYFGEKFNKVFKSITSDNGAEFSELANLEDQYNTKVYFAHPYSSFERGTNEKHNGMIRKFVPKGKSISNYSAKYIAHIENWCNTLPRKILDYYTPDEIFSKHLQGI